MKSIPLILMGCGGVGRQLLEHIVSCRPLHAKQGVRLRVVGVSDSKSLLVAPDVFTTELNDPFLLEVCRIKSDGLSLLKCSGFGECKAFTNPESLREVTNIAARLVRSTGLTFVDCSASSDTIPLLTQMVDLGGCVVLANKKPLTSSMEDFDKLVLHPRHIRHESTVMADSFIFREDDGYFVVTAKKVGRSFWDGVLELAEYQEVAAPSQFGSEKGNHVLRIEKANPGGLDPLVGAGLPIIASLNRMLSSGDPIRLIVGSLSGTLGYVMSEVEDGKPFSEVVKAAKGFGYTEPDPRDDLSGMDVARKALILARLLGLHINMDNIKIESLYPEKMGPNMMSVEDFLVNGLPLLDKDIAERVKSASLKGNVLRYVCVIEDSGCKVGIQELPKESALGRLRGSDNVVEIYSRCYNTQSLVIQGAGAGNDTTAAGVLADILDLQDLFPLTSPGISSEISWNEPEYVI